MLYLIAATSLYIVWRACREWRFDGVTVTRAIPLFMSVPLLLCYVWIFKLHPVFRWWSDPGSRPPRPWVLAFSFGLPLLLLMSSLESLRKRPLSEAGRVSICCLLSASLLVYTYPLLHFSFQFATDIAIPLVFVAIIGMEDVWSKWRLNSKWQTWLIVGSFLVVNSLASWTLVAREVKEVRQGEFRVDAGVLEGYAWLDRNSHSGAVVLADYDNSNRHPQYTHDNVFCGYYNAVRYSEKRQEVDRFLSPETTNAYREGLVKQVSVEFVVLQSDEDQKLFHLKDAPFLRETFRNDAVVIYAVV
jgi:hypothetical protein